MGGKKKIMKDGYGFEMEEMPLDILMLRDRTYFDRNPSCLEYIREIVAGEFPYPIGVPGIPCYSSDGSEWKYVLVQRNPQYPGIRFCFMMSARQFAQLKNHASATTNEKGRVARRKRRSK